MKNLLTATVITMIMLLGGGAWGYLEDFEDNSAQGWGQWWGGPYGDPDAMGWVVPHQGDVALAIDANHVWVDDGTSWGKFGYGTYSTDLHWDPAAGWSDQPIGWILLASNTNADPWGGPYYGLKLFMGYWTGSPGVQLRAQIGGAEPTIASTPWAETPMDGTHGSDRINFQAKAVFELDPDGITKRLSVYMRTMDGPWMALNGLQDVDVTAYVLDSTGSTFADSGFMGFKGHGPVGYKHWVDNVGFQPDFYWVPEPGSMALVGMIALAFLRRRK